MSEYGEYLSYEDLEVWRWWNTPELLVFLILLAIVGTIYGLFFLGKKINFILELEKVTLRKEYRKWKHLSQLLTKEGLDCELSHVKESDNILYTKNNTFIHNENKATLHVMDNATGIYRSIPYENMTDIELKIDKYEIDTKPIAAQLVAILTTRANNKSEKQEMIREMKLLLNFDENIKLPYLYIPLLESTINQASQEYEQAYEKGLLWLNRAESFMNQTQPQQHKPQPIIDN